MYFCGVGTHIHKVLSGLWKLFGAIALQEQTKVVTMGFHAVCVAKVSRDWLTHPLFIVHPYGTFVGRVLLDGP